jgi:hypothetical protein
VSILNQSNGNIFFYIITFHNSELLFQTAVWLAVLNIIKIIVELHWKCLILSI